MQTSLVDLVRRPSAFFAAAEPRPSLVGPALVAATLGASVVARLLLLLDTLRGVAEGFSGPPLVYAVGQFAVAAPRTLVVASLFVGLLFFVGWFLVAGVVYVVSRYYDPEGSFRRLLALVGWGQVPTLVPALASTAYVAFAVATAPDVGSQAAAETWMQTTFERSVVQQVIQVAGPVFAVWTAYLWVLAAEHGLSLSRRQALVCVALPATLVVLNSLNGAFTVVSG